MRARWWAMVLLMSSLSLPKALHTQERMSSTLVAVHLNRDRSGWVNQQADANRYSI
jgi:hypothetical protein